MSKFKLKIVTPRGIYKEVDVDMLNLKTTAGQIGILANHIPLASGIEISKMSYVIDKERFEFAIAGGFVYVNEDETTVIANAIESPEEINEARANEAKQRAQNRMNSNSPDIDMKRAEIALLKAINRINVKSQY